MRFGGGTSVAPPSQERRLPARCYGSPPSGGPCACHQQAAVDRLRSTPPSAPGSPLVPPIHQHRERGPWRSLAATSTARSWSTAGCWTATSACASTRTTPRRPGCRWSPRRASALAGSPSRTGRSCSELVTGRPDRQSRERSSLGGVAVAVVVGSIPVSPVRCGTWVARPAKLDAVRTLRRRHELGRRVGSLQPRPATCRLSVASMLVCHVQACRSMANQG
jgi:hypothetical protein